jgi:hypothetical protein
MGMDRTPRQRIAIHFYNAKGEFSFFRLGYRSQSDAEQDAVDELVLPTRAGYRAEVRARVSFTAESIILAHVACNGEITYVQPQ